MVTLVAEAQVEVVVVLIEGDDDADLTVTSFQVAEFRITGTVSDRNWSRAATLYWCRGSNWFSAKRRTPEIPDTGPSPLKSSFAAHHANLGASAGLLRSIAICSGGRICALA